MKPRVLYIASGGIREPLIVSQVIRYLKRLSDVYETCHLMTLEREMPNDADAIKATLADSGIHWHGLPAYPGKRMINLWREIWNGYRTGRRLIKSHDLNIIHARSFIPGNIGLRLARKTKAKFLYDMRGFWAEEKFAKGTIKSAWLKRRAQAMENRLFHGADSLVSLTHAGKKKLIADGITTPIEVIPCCADTKIFRPLSGQESVRPAEPNALNMISVGSLGPGYLPDSVLGLYQAMKEANPSPTRLTLLTRTPHEIIAEAASRVGCSLDDVTITSASPDEVVQYLNAADVGLCMIAPSLAKIASSPTKLAEYLACGLPVIANCQSIGDMQAILAENQIGVAVEEQTPEGWREAAAAMLQCLKDPAMKETCRDLAVSLFSVDVGVATYGSIYQQLVESRQR